MSKRVWDRFLTDRDRAVLEASGFGNRAGFGKRPVLMIVDVNYAFCGERPEPILQAIKRWRTSCGEEAWRTLPTIRKLIDAMRAKGVPLIYTTSSHRSDRWDEGAWAWKGSGLREDGDIGSNRPAGDAILEEIAPAPRDLVVLKQKPSGFFGTPLMSYLTLLKVDSVIITGTTTSGCVRATAVDAFSNNLRVIVVEDACFDRFEVSHALSLCDMHAKYADVISSEEVVKYLETLPEGLFELPMGCPAETTSDLC